MILSKKVSVIDPTGKEFDQVVEYEWIPQYYNECLQVGHKCAPRKQKKKKAQNGEEPNKQHTYPQRQEKAWITKQTQVTDGAKMNAQPSPTKLNKENKDEWSQVKGKFINKTQQTNPKRWT